MLLAILLACRCNDAPEAMSLTFEDRDLQQIGGRFVDEPQEPVAADVAFLAKDLCPALERASLVPAQEGIWEVTVHGERLDRVKRVGATLAGGALANVAFEATPDGGLRFPVACRDCDVYLGVRVGSRTVACLGPGYSLRWKHGVPG